MFDEAAFKKLISDAVEAAFARATPTASLPEVLTLDEAAALLQLHPKVVAKYVRERGLPALRIGREYRFRRSALMAWLDGQSL